LPVHWLLGIFSRCSPCEAPGRGRLPWPRGAPNPAAGLCRGSGGCVSSPPACAGRPLLREHDASAGSGRPSVERGRAVEGKTGPSIEIGAQAAALGLGWFWLGDLDEPWDSGARFEVIVRRRMGRRATIEPFFGGYAYYEEHEWKEAGARVDYEALGLGAELGVVVDPFLNPPDASWRITMTPYSRLGMGFPDGRFDRVVRGAGTTSGDFDGLRAEGSVVGEEGCLSFPGTSTTGTSHSNDEDRCLGSLLG